MVSFLGFQYNSQFQLSDIIINIYSRRRFMDKINTCKQTQLKIQHREELDVYSPNREVSVPESKVQPRNRMWKNEEHLLYLIFLELNKEKVKSKLVRHSNNFFKEMSAFVKSKTDIQCRSHHHKYEERYKYPYRIIKEERIRLQEQGVSFYSALEQIRQTLNVSEGLDRLDRQESRNHLENVLQGSKGVTAEVQCQTDIQGTTMVLITQEDYQRRILMPYYDYSMMGVYPPPYPTAHYESPTFRFY